MITLKDFMETVNYRITEGSDYQWQCFGSDAYCLDSWNGDQNGHTVSICIDTKTQEVYQAMAYDYSRGRAYRITNPDYKKDFDNECKDRDILDCAWQDDEGTPVKYVDLDVDEDFVEKSRAIVNEEEYDTRVQIPIDFTDEELLTYMTMAHERDMTFNEFVEEALRHAIDEFKLREELDEIQPPVFQQHPFPPDSFTLKDAEDAVKKVKKKKKGKL